MRCAPTDYSTPPTLSYSPVRESRREVRNGRWDFALAFATAQLTSATAEARLVSTPTSLSIRNPVIKQSCSQTVAIPTPPTSLITSACDCLRERPSTQRTLPGECSSTPSLLFLQGCDQFLRQARSRCGILAGDEASVDDDLGL